MKRRVKVVLFSLLGVLSALVLVGAVGLIWVRTPSGSRFLLGQLKSYLAKSQSVQLDYKEGSLDPFSGLHFSQLSLQQKLEQRQMQVTVNSVDLSFSLSFWHRSLLVDHLTVDRPKIQLRVLASAAPDSANKENSEPKQNTPLSDPVEKIRQWLSSPPVKVTLKQFNLANLSADIETDGFIAKIPDLNLKSNFQLVPNHLVAASDFNLAEGGSLAYSKKTGDEQLTFRASPHGFGKLVATIHPEGKGWVYEIQPSTEASFSADAIAVERNGGGSNLKLNMASISLDSKWIFLAKTAELFKFDQTTLQAVDLKNHFAARELTFNSQSGNRQKEVKLASQSGFLNADLNKNLAFNFEWMGQQLFSPGAMTRAAQLTARSKIQCAPDLASLEASGESILDNIPLGSFKLAAQAGENLKVEGHAAVTADRKLATLMKEGAGLRRLGVVAAALSLKSNVNGKFKNLADWQDGKIADAAFTTNLNAQVAQNDAKGSSVKFAPIQATLDLKKNGQALSFAAHLNGDSLSTLTSKLSRFSVAADGQSQNGEWKVQLLGDLSQVKMAALKQNLALGLKTNINYRPAKNDVDFESHLQLQNEPALSVQGSAVANGEGFKLKTKAQAQTGNYLHGLLADHLMQAYGQWQAVGEWQWEVLYPTVKNETFLDGGTFRTSGTTTFTQTVSPNPRSLASEMSLSAAFPLVFKHRFDLIRGKADGDFNGQMPSLEMAQWGKMVGSELTASFSSSHLSKNQDVDVEAKFKQTNLQVAPSLASELPPMNGLNAAFKATLRGGDQFTLQNFAADFNHSMFSASAQATGRFKKKDFLVQGKMAVEVPKNFPALKTHTLKGRLEFPWTVSVLGGREIDFAGDLALLNLGWSKGPERISGISGHIPVSEKFILDGKKIKFTHLITQNPFERVDYERLRPLIQGAEQVRIEQIGYEEKSYGPLVGFFSMDQNMIFAHQFDFNLGSKGLAYGEMYFDVYPANLQLGILSRLTALNLNEILPQRFLASSPKGDKNLSGRSGVVVNLNKGSVDGRIDITEIGANQLITLINVLDPKYEDDKMNMTRTALSVGAPTFVQMSFDNGYMDLGVEVSAFGLSQRFDVREIPISTLVSSATADLVKKTQEGPLE